jgi:hypothetical protein
MLNALKKLFGIKQAEAPAAEVPYKVEARSFEDTSDIAIAQRPNPVAEQASEAVIASIPAKKAPAKKAPAKKTPAAKKPRAPKVAK